MGVASVGDGMEGVVDEVEGGWMEADWLVDVVVDGVVEEVVREEEAIDAASADAAVVRLSW